MGQLLVFFSSDHRAKERQRHLLSVHLTKKKRRKKTTRAFVPLYPFRKFHA